MKWTWLKIGSPINGENVALESESLGFEFKLSHFMQSDFKQVRFFL
jgi:hypothetical protein